MLFLAENQIIMSNLSNARTGLARTRFPAPEYTNHQMIDSTLVFIRDHLNEHLKLQNIKTGKRSTKTKNGILI